MAHPAILVVDDDPAFLEILADALGDEGYTVLTARDGESALYLANRLRPALVLADIGMPGLNGIVLARRLRQVGIPVILMSAGTRYLPLPGVEYLPKPIDLDTLSAEIERALRARRASDRAPYLPTSTVLSRPAAPPASDDPAPSPLGLPLHSRRPATPSSTS